ncbi:coiled-coil domain-containing protein 12 isoform X2 [Bos taurus]|uniref:coiled-coil domain-containing protein 12 isoform X2 n=1 Tax=Bos taurus TaxID=9913 RepID=UPI000383E75C|nr:coiled-coil domain-containing protein 12 isoform X2 [Bos taurus]
MRKSRPERLNDLPKVTQQGEIKAMSCAFCRRCQAQGRFPVAGASDRLLETCSRESKDKEDGEPNTKQLREGEEEGEKHRELRLRNYVPEDEDLKKRRVPQAKPVAVEEKVKEQLEAAKPEPVIEEVDLANLAPRKPDWDLKRDVAKKLEKLEKRTQRAIAELIRERLKGQEENLASAVATTAATEPEACDSD